jgi:hypothetical protein
MRKHPCHQFVLHAIINCCSLVFRLLLRDVGGIRSLRILDGSKLRKVEIFIEDCEPAIDIRGAASIQHAHLLFKVSSFGGLTLCSGSLLRWFTLLQPGRRFVVLGQTLFHITKVASGVSDVLQGREVDPGCGSVCMRNF